ncbi:MAG: alcohol dehydrogenase [Gemmatimonadetes bacterium]|nr:MAG: alcohol dehydrogenase [Gemmatimonadota bacterium]
MQVIRIHETGSPGVLRCEEIDPPVIRPDQVLVRIKATAINHLDIWIRKGIPKVPLPMILGSDAAGTIAEVGSAVHGWNVGNDVVLQPAVSCGRCESCLKGRDNFCAHYEIRGEQVNGFNAEYVAVSPADMIPKPPSIAYEEAAAIPLAFMTAWEMLIRKAQLQPGQTVLIWGAGSGVGSSALQIAKLCGAYIIATAGSKTKLKQAKALGAHHVIHHYEHDVSAEVKKITNRRGVDVVVEHVGQATWNQSLKCLAKGGKLVTCGATTGYDVKIDLRFLFFKQHQILGSTMGSRGDLHQIIKLVEHGHFKGIVDRIFPFDQVANAHQYVEDKHHFGKVVLIPNSQFSS